jgi:hypothetical protein
MVRLVDGSGIRMASGEDVILENVYAGDRAFDYGSGLPAYVLYLLLNNPWRRPEIAGVNLIMEYDDEPRSATIRRAAPDRYRVRPGESIRVRVDLEPYRGRERTVSTEIRVPEETPPGMLTIHVGGAVALSRTEEPDEPLVPRDLDQLIRLINRIRRNDQVYVAATRDDRGLLLDGWRLPNLPPSAATLLTRPRNEGVLHPLPRRAVLEDSIPTEWFCEGSTRFDVVVTAP